MRMHTCWWALVALVTIGCGGAAQADLAPKRPKDRLVVQSFALENGLDVELAAGPCGERVGLALLFDVGADHDPAGRAGMAEVIGRLLTPADDALVQVGGDHTLVARAVDEGGLASALSDLAETMGRGEVTADALSSARDAVREELARRRGGDAALTARIHAWEAVQPSAAGGWRGGVAEELDAIDAEAIGAHMAAHYAPANARLVVVGDIDPFAVRQRVHAAFAELAPGEAPTAREPAGATVTGTLVMGDAPAAVALAVPAPPVNDALYPAFLVLAARLTSTDEDGWEAEYDPVLRPEVLFVTGSIAAGEPPEPVAERIRVAVQDRVHRALEPGEITAARTAYASFLGVDATVPETCATDPRRLAVARARRAALRLDDRPVPLAEALEEANEEARRSAEALFGPRRSAAVAGGGVIR